MKDIDAEKAEGAETTVYEDYLEGLKTEGYDMLKTVNKTLLGVMTESDISLFENYLKDTYPDDYAEEHPEE